MEEEKTVEREMPENIKSIMQEFNIEAVNVKVICNIYMKNLRFLSYDPETAIEKLKKVLVLSSFVVGESV